MKRAVTIVMIFISAASVAADRPVEEKPIQIHVQNIFVTPTHYSLRYMAGELSEAVKLQCAPFNEVRELNLTVKIVRWSSDSDTQSLDVDGTAVCSPK